MQTLIVVHNNTKSPSGEYVVVEIDTEVIKRLLFSHPIEYPCLRGVVNSVSTMMRFQNYCFALDVVRAVANDRKRRGLNSPTEVTLLGMDCNGFRIKQTSQL